MDGLIHDTDAQPGLELSPRRPEVDHPGYRGEDSRYNDMYQQRGTKEAASIDTVYIDAAYFNAAHMDAAYIGELPKPTTPIPRICGLPRRTFWIAFALALVVLGGVLGEGLGGGLLVACKGKHVPTPQQQKQQQQSMSSVFSSSASSTPSSTSTFHLSLTLSSALKSSSISISSSVSTPSLTASSSSAATSSATSTCSTSSASSTASTFSETSTAPSASAFPSSAPTSTASGILPFSTQPGTYRIVNVATNTTVDLFNGLATNGTEIVCWAWDTNTVNNQTWQLSSVGDSAITIMNTQTNSYITAPSDLINGMDPTTDSDYAEVFGGTPGNPSNLYMQWEIQANCDNSISFSSKAYPSKLLDLDAGNPANGAAVLLWGGNGELNQHWRLASP